MELPNKQEWKLLKTCGSRRVIQGETWLHIVWHILKDICLFLTWSQAVTRWSHLHFASQVTKDITWNCCPNRTLFSGLIKQNVILSSWSHLVTKSSNFYRVIFGPQTLCSQSLALFRRHLPCFWTWSQAVTSWSQLVTPSFCFLGPKEQSHKVSSRSDDV